MIGEPGKLILKFNLEESDNPIPSTKYQMDKKIVTVVLPDELDPENIHPDHIGLACILIAEPFIGESITLPKPVSGFFFREHSKVTSKYKITSYDESIERYVPTEDSVVGLAFSGGVDSTAALSLLPPSTIPIFMDRPLRGKSLYNKDAVLNSCREVRRLGYDMQVIECDLEYVRKPIGFPVDVANSVPVILLAGHLNLDCVAFGTILESSYGAGHKSFRQYPTGNHYKHLGGMFAAAGLPFNLPVAGISEVGTSIIVEKSPLGFVAQSCMRGIWKSPCLNCWKCFRKQILEAAIKNKPIERQIIHTLFENKEALRHISAIPIKHENVLTWATNRLDDDFKLFNLLKTRLMGDSYSFDWLSNWYSKSIEVVPEKYRDFVINKIEIYLETMSEEEEEVLESWSMDYIIENPNTINHRDNLVNAMQEFIISDLESI